MLELYYLKEADSVCSNRAVITLAEKRIDDWIPHYIKLLNEDHFESDYLKINPQSGRADTGARWAPHQGILHHL